MEFSDMLKLMIILFILFVIYFILKKLRITQNVKVLKKEEHFVQTMNGGLIHSKKIRVITDNKEIMELNILTKKTFNAINVGNQYEIKRLGTICLKIKMADNY